MRKLSFLSFKEVGLTGAGTIAVTVVHSGKGVCACPARFEYLSSKMVRRCDSSIFSSDKTNSRIPTIFFSSNKRIPEYLYTVLEQSLLLTRWHQKECTHMNKTCTAIENITNDAFSQIVKIQTRNSYSIKN